MIAHYHPLLLHPYPWRTEHVAIGAVVFREDGVRVHLADNLKKVRAFAPGVDLDAVRAWPTELQTLLAETRTPAEANAKLAVWGGLRRLGEQHGQMRYRDEREYADRVAGILARLVEPEKAIRDPLQAAHKSRLDIDLKRAFSGYGWLGKTPADIDHRIVPRYPLDADTGLVADFAVKNGRLNVIETVDFRVADPASKRETAQAKALVLACAPAAARYAIVAGGEGPDAAPSLRLLERHAAGNLIRWEDAGAMNAFLAAMAQATGKPLIALPTI